MASNSPSLRTSEHDTTTTAVESVDQLRSQWQRSRQEILEQDAGGDDLDHAGSSVSTRAGFATVIWWMSVSDTPRSRKAGRT